MKDRAKEFAPLVEWALARLGLEDWTILLSVSDEEPEWVADSGAENVVGLCGVYEQHNTAHVWVSPTRTAEDSKAQRSLESYVLHELGHVWAIENGWEEVAAQAPRRNEVAWNRLADVMEALWRATCG
jgi:hypothetical protein